MAGLNHLERETIPSPQFLRVPPGDIPLGTPMSFSTLESGIAHISGHRFHEQFVKDLRLSPLEWHRVGDSNTPIVTIGVRPNQDNSNITEAEALQEAKATIVFDGNSELTARIRVAVVLPRGERIVATTFRGKNMDLAEFFISIMYQELYGMQDPAVINANEHFSSVFRPLPHDDFLITSGIITPGMIQDVTQNPTSQHVALMKIVRDPNRTPFVHFGDDGKLTHKLGFDIVDSAHGIIVRHIRERHNRYGEPYTQKKMLISSIPRKLLKFPLPQL